VILDASVWTASVKIPVERRALVQVCRSAKRVVAALSQSAAQERMTAFEIAAVWRVSAMIPVR